MNDLLRGYALAAMESAEQTDSLYSLKDAIDALVAAIESSHDLRRVLVDSAVPASTRRSIVAELLGDAPAGARELLSYAVLVVGPADYVVQVEELAQLAETLLLAGRAANERLEPPAGRQAIRHRIRGYTERRLIELKEASAIDEVEDELFRLARIFEANSAIVGALSDESSLLEARLSLLDDLLSDKASAVTIALISFVLRCGRLRDLVGQLDYLVELTAEERGRRVAEVRSVTLLGVEESARLAAALEQMTGRKVEIRNVADPSVIGGMVVSVGDLIIDGTLRLRLERLREALSN